MSHITAELVEAVAAARVNAHAAHYGAMPESDRARVPDFVLHTWDEQEPMTKHGVRETVLNQLNEILPHLIDAGWLPPAKHDAIRETVRDLSVNELHKSLMDSLRRQPAPGYHDTPEGFAGYSEGIEHGTISIASRIKTILDGDSCATIRALDGDGRE